MEQLSFPWEIDREATRDAVEERLESARLYKKFGFIRREMKTTASSKPRYHGQTNEVTQPVEEIAIYNVDAEQRMKEQYEQVERAISRLKRLERLIINKRYMEDEDVYDYNVYSEIHMSERTYYRWKSSAIYQLAFALRLERYLTQE